MWISNKWEVCESRVIHFGLLEIEPYKVKSSNCLYSCQYTYLFSTGKNVLLEYVALAAAPGIAIVTSLFYVTISYSIKIK